MEKHKFIMFKFDNERAFNKVKNLWYTTPRKRPSAKANEFTRRKLNPSDIFTSTPQHIFMKQIFLHFLGIFI